MVDYLVTTHNILVLEYYVLHAFLHPHVERIKLSSHVLKLSQPPGKRIINSRWVYQIKTKSYSSRELHEARLVVKVFSHEFGVDYE